MDGIYVLDVAEVENLFLVPELIKFMEDHLVRDESIVEEIKEFICKIFMEQKGKQIQESFIKEVNSSSNN